MGQYAERLPLRTVPPTTAVVRGDDLVTSAYQAYHQELYSFLRERTAELEAALAGLPADARLGLLLAGQGFSGREIAEAIGRSEAATRTLMCRVRMRVRSQLEASEPDRHR
jgi:DNA-directed RNA polymerase specialized sigma24 family protein